MPQLIIACILIYLYYLAMKWLLVVAGPEVLVISSLLLVAAVPITYGRALFRTFGTRGVRNVFLVPVVSLLVLLYVDCAMATIFGTSDAGIQAQVTPAISAAAERVFFGSFPNRQTLDWLRGLAPHLPWLLMLVAVVGAKCLLILPLSLANRGLQNKVEHAAQPAYVQYFYAQAFRDAGAVATETMETLTKVYAVVAAVIFKATAGPQAIFIWPLTIAAAVSLLPPAIIAGTAMVVVLVLHVAALAAVWGASSFVALALHCMERAVMLARRSYARCPHAGCHETVPLPVFRCPSCGARHSRLVPGRFGMLQRACTCGRATLRTLFWLGKGRVASECPRCNREMREELFGANVHVPIYGGASAGKTMYMMATTWQLLEGQLRWTQARLIDERRQKDYDSIWKSRFETGRVWEKTVARLPDAFLLSLRRRDGLPVSTYLYDPAGEAMTDQADLDGHRFIRYFDGLVLLIDPLSLPTLARLQAESDARGLPPTTSAADPADLVHNLVGLLEKQGSLSRGRRYERRIAVVFTKADLPIVQRELGAPPETGTPSGSWKACGQAGSERIEAWLARNEPVLLQLLRTRFAHLRFFAVSALGHAPEDSGPFTPMRTLDPFCWVLAGQRTLTLPRAARFGRRLTELAVAGAVLAFFLGLPYAALRVWGGPSHPEESSDAVAP